MEDVGKIVAGFVGGIATDEIVRFATKERPPEGHKKIANEINIRRTWKGETVVLEPRYLFTWGENHSLWGYLVPGTENPEILASVHTLPKALSVEFGRMGAAGIEISFRGVTRTMEAGLPVSREVVAGYTVITIER